jgi:hypothetical protein
MRTFWLFRSNIRNLEYYHSEPFHKLEWFKEACHDFYMLFPLWLLENNYFDEVIIWRLSSNQVEDIVFDINGKKYIQKWVRNFIECIDYQTPEISFFRGGFKEYDEVTSKRPGYFGLKLYLGAGRRTFSQWGGKYDVYLVEDERDVVQDVTILPFYKTASPSVFQKLESDLLTLNWDICWPCNFEQIRYKGQEYFLNLIANDSYLKTLKIVHCGNKNEVGKKICQEHNINNIHFAGQVDRPQLNMFLNRSKFGLNLSNLQDGCPRVSTEILMSGTPLIVSEETRLLKYYKQQGVMEVNQKNIVNRIKFAMDNYEILKDQVSYVIKNELSFDNICKKNIELWQKIGLG